MLHRRKRREAGKCAREGCPHKTGSAYYYCESHRAEHAERMRAFRKRQGRRVRRKKKTYWGVTA